MTCLEWLDAKHFLRMNLWDFSIRSLARKYGWNFLSKVVFRHPLKTMKGIQRYRQAHRRVFSTTLQERIDSHPAESGKGRETFVVGVGFCLKPLDPPCISGRANHDCVFFERNLHGRDHPIPDCCQQCSIREIGTLASAAGCHFYIMTSANDILHDLLAPALKDNRFTNGLFGLCRYSFAPFQLALFIAGIEGILFPYERGDCRDYVAWLRADNGVKDEQTEIHGSDFQTMQKWLSGLSIHHSTKKQFKKIGNIFHPQ
ncbi:MAG: hypothetical protein C4527_24525 [Candidatus Omnitrophota bacterium]|jgi:hypothetical protein|nr:MAG: hypothetical protein C4527_24525 [Candidatus Omnitrophota bacterium]